MDYTDTAQWKAIIGKDTPIPPTPNISFNEAVKTLLQYHHTRLHAAWINLDISNRPTNLRSPKDRKWIEYVDALLKVTIIGKRNNWLTIHTDTRGNEVFLILHPEEWEHQTKKGGDEMGEKQLRCGDCKMCAKYKETYYQCWATTKLKRVNPGWYAGKCFVYKDK